MEESSVDGIVISEKDMENSGLGLGVLELGKRLLFASKGGKTEIVRDLMKGGAPFATDWLGNTSLHAAAGGGHLETCELLLRSGIMKDARTKVEKTPLHLACQEGHYEVALLLIGHGADVNANDMLYMTPLHWAVEKAHIETIKTLLHNGSDPMLSNKFDKSCFDIARDSGRQDIIDLLINEAKDGVYTVMNKQIAEPAEKKSIFTTVTKSPELLGSNNSSRPRTAILLPSFKKTITSSPAEVVNIIPSIKQEEEEEEEEEVVEEAKEDYEDEEEQTRIATLQLLEEHGIEMLEEDINLVTSAVGHGQQLVLTEAGKQALSMTETSVKRQSPLSVKPNLPKVIKITTAPHTPTAVTRSIRGTDRRIHRIFKTNPMLVDINKKLKVVQQQAEQYKLLYAKKQREAAEYKQKLEETMTMLEQEEEEEEEEEEEDEEEIEEEEDE